MKVQTTKALRDKALKEGKGIVTLEVIYPGKTGKKLGARITMQGPATQAECDRIARLIGRVIESAAKKK